MVPATKEAMDRATIKLKEMTKEEKDLTVWSILVDNEMMVLPHYHDNTISQIEENVNPLNKKGGVLRDLVLAILVVLVPVLASVLLYIVVMVLPLGGFYSSLAVVLVGSVFTAYSIIRSTGKETI